MESKKFIATIISSVFFIFSLQASNCSQTNTFVKESGFYLGINGGYSWGNAEAKVTTTISSDNPYLFSPDIPLILKKGDFHFHPQTGMGGVQLGYNSCLSNNVLVGIETDFGFFHYNRSKSISLVYPEATLATFTIYQKIDTHWLYTLRPRLGYIYQRMLFFLTGGLSVTDLHYKEIFSDDYYTFYPSPPGANAYQLISKRKTIMGWTVGAGLEYLLINHLSLCLTYLYSNFNTTSFRNLLQVVYGGDNYQNPFQDQVSLNANSLRLGLNWQI